MYKCIELSYLSVQIGSNTGAREFWGIWFKYSIHSQGYHTMNWRNNIFKADRKWHVIIYNCLSYSSACIFFSISFLKKNQMQLKLPAPYSCNKRNCKKKGGGGWEWIRVATLLEIIMLHESDHRARLFSRMP